MKDEYRGIAIQIFVGIVVNSCEKCIYKGHNVTIRNDEFMDVLFNKKVIRHIMKGIKSFGHRMYTYESIRISLSAFDGKRYILDDGIHTLVYGHKDIPK